MARKWHPDVNDSEQAKEEFQKISRAYEVLSDQNMRQRYDQFGEAGVSTSAAGGGYGQGMEVDLGDIFDSFFGGGGGGRGAAGARGRQVRKEGYFCVYCVVVLCCVVFELFGCVSGASEFEVLINYCRFIVVKLSSHFPCFNAHRD